MPARPPHPYSQEDQTSPSGQQASSGWRWLKWLLGASVAGLLALLLILGLALALAFPKLPDVAALADYRPKLPLRVLSADGETIAEFGEERRNLTTDRGHPAGHDQCRAGDRGCPLLRAQRGRLHRHAARGTGQLGAVQEPGRLDHHDAGGTQRLPLEREELPAQDLRGAADLQARGPAEQGPDPRDLHEPDLPGSPRLRFRRCVAGLLRQAAARTSRWPKPRCWPACPRRPRPTTRSPTPNAPASVRQLHP